MIRLGGVRGALPKTTRYAAVALLGVLAAACREQTPRSPAEVAAARVADSVRLAGTTADVDLPKLVQRCALCHQANGQGTTNIFPPLANAEYVNGPADRLVALMLRGVRGPMTVRGISYNNQMMPYGDGGEMTDTQLSAVLTYVRTNWGNRAGAISAVDVARIRSATASRVAPYSAAELDAMR